MRTAEEIVRDADLAMYSAKRGSRGDWCLKSVRRGGHGLWPRGVDELALGETGCAFRPADNDVSLGCWMSGVIMDRGSHHEQA